MQQSHLDWSTDSLWSDQEVSGIGRRLEGVLNVETRAQLGSAGSFGYNYIDASGLLERLTLPNGSSITNTFDSVARLTETGLKESGGAVLNGHEYLHTEGHQRTNTTRTIVGSTNTVDYTYDPGGQLTGARGYEADSTVRLHETFGYAYDEAMNLSHTTNNALVQAFAVNPLNQITNSNAWKSEFTYDVFYAADGNGNVTAMVNEHEVIATRYAYELFGRLLSASGPMADRNSYRFSSKEEHGESGLVYFGRRHYDPATARWQKTNDR